MKHRLGLQLSGALGAIALSTAALLPLNNPANAQPSKEPTLFSFFEQAQSSLTALNKNGYGNALSDIEELELSAAQQAEIAAIQTELDEQIAEILTADQIQTLMDSRNSGSRSDMRRMVMGLTQEQRSSVMSIMRSAQSNVMNVLTPEQRAQIQESKPRDRN